MKFNFNPFPTLSTERLTLREICNNDFTEILYLRSDKEINKYIQRATTQDEQAVTQFLKIISEGMQEGRNVNWGITLHGNDKIIGTICLWNFSEDGKIGEVGYDLNPSFQRKGIMSEALRSVLEYGFEKLNLEKIEAYTHFENESSKNLLLKNGFELVENKKDEDNKDNIIFSKKSNHGRFA